MAKARAETIILKGDPIMSEGRADAAITPGHLVKRTGTGVAVQTRDGVAAPPTFAKENDIAGDDFTHAYAATETVLFFTAYPGMVVQAFLKSGEDIDVGEKLISGAGGELKAGTDANEAVGISLEDSGGATTAVTRIKVEIV